MMFSSLSRAASGTVAATHKPMQLARLDISAERRSNISSIKHSNICRFIWHVPRQRASALTCGSLAAQYPRSERGPGRKRSFEKEEFVRNYERPAKISRGGRISDVLTQGPPARRPAPPAKQLPHKAPVYLTGVPIVRAGKEDKGTFYSSHSFKRVGASQEVLNALNSLGIRRPSNIQAQSFQALAAGGPPQVVLADAAGSGKTLAYLLPLLQQLREKEAANKGPVTKPHQPSIVVMCPTAELAQQVFRVVRGLSKGGLKARSAAFTSTSSGNYRTQKETLKAGCDIAICTPLRLTALMEYGDLSLAGCNALVLDEVDILLGDSSAFSEQVEPLLAVGGEDMRLVMVTATLPDHTFDQLRKMFPNMAAAFGPGLHKVAPGLVEELVDCSGGEEVNLESGTQRKLAALLSVLQQHRAQRALVFCNKIDTCRRVENFLQRQDRKGDQYKVLAYHAAITKAAQQAALDKFLADEGEGGVPMYLVCTDRTSRGLDSILCEHVVLFDFPRDPSEYVRRVGRTARGAGGTGSVSILVLGKQVPLAKSILERNRKGGTVHRIPLTYTPWAPPPASRSSRDQPTPSHIHPVQPHIDPPSEQDYDDYAEQISRAVRGERQGPSGSDTAGDGVVIVGGADSISGSGSSSGADLVRGSDSIRGADSKGGSDSVRGAVSKGASQAEKSASAARVEASGRSDVGSHEVEGLEEDGMEDEMDEEFMDEDEFEDEDEDEDEEFLGGTEEGIEPGDDFVVVKAPPKKK